MDEEVKKARREREQFANEQRLRHEMLAKMINARKLTANLPHSLPNHFNYQRSLLPPTPQPKSEAVSEVLDLTKSPCPSPDIKTATSNLNGVSVNVLNSRGRQTGVVPETFDLEDLISLEQQRQVVLNSNMRIPSSHSSLNIPQQHVHTLKPNHSSFGVLTQQQNATGSAQYSALLSQLRQGKDKSKMFTQMRQKTSSSSQPSHVMLHQNSIPHSSSVHSQLLKRHANEHAQSQPMQTQSERPSRPKDEFDFDDLDYGYPSPDSQIQYRFTSQALPSLTPPLPPYSSSLFAPVPPNSSLSDSSSSSSHFTPSSSSSSEQTHLLQNGHSSMDSLETLDHMIHGTPSDHRQSVIQFKSVDWDAT